MKTMLLPSLAALGALSCATALATPAADDAAAEDRVTRSAEGFAVEHAADELRDPRSLQVHRVAAAEVARKPRGGSPAGPQIQSSSFGDSWIFDATTELFYDYDRDGYYHFIRVTFDADTIHTFRNVYARIFISADGNSWEEIYRTNDFTIWGRSATDDYEVETELVSGYSTGLYDVLIELYDSDDDVLVDEFGPNESPDFSVRALEDAGRDGIGTVGGDPVSESHGGGGALGWLAIGGLLALVLARARTAYREAPASSLR